MLKVISFKICPFVQRVIAHLEAKGVPYEVQYIDLSQKPDWFLDISPTGQVPVLITDDGMALFESDAIVEYLTEIHGSLQQGLTAEDRARQRAWNYQGSKNYLVQCSAMRSPDETTLQERSETLSRAFARVDEILPGSGFAFGKFDLGAVDIAWIPLLHRASMIERLTGYDFVPANGSVKIWQRRVLGTGIAERSVPEDFEQRFIDFYLSEDSWLGQMYRHQKAA